MHLFHQYQDDPVFGKIFEITRPTHSTNDITRKQKAAIKKTLRLKPTTGDLAMETELRSRVFNREGLTAKQYKQLAKILKIKLTEK